MKILITGCDTGLGKVLLNKLIKQDIFVIPHFKNISSCRTRRRGIIIVDSNAIIGDINDSKVRDAIETQCNLFGISVFINNAAIYEHKPFLEHSDEIIENILHTNLISPILLIKKIYKHFQNIGKGLIININSIACKNPGAGETIYTASKTGIEGFSRSLQIESLNSKIKIVDIYLGAMKTPMSQWRPNYEKLIDPEEVAETIINLFLHKPKTLATTEIVIRRN
jgi:3-oxoacyl-[acyl-carrier protein] reductase